MVDLFVRNTVEIRDRDDNGSYVGTIFRPVRPGAPWSATGVRVGTVEAPTRGEMLSVVEHELVTTGWSPAVASARGIGKDRISKLGMRFGESPIGAGNSEKSTKQARAAASWTRMTAQAQACAERSARHTDTITPSDED